MGNFGQRLRRLRTDKGMSMEDVADRLGVHDQTVRNWEAGASMPNEFNQRMLQHFFPRIGVIVRDEMARSRKVTTTMYLNSEQADWLRDRAWQDGVTMAGLVRAALDAFIAAHEEGAA